MKMVDVKEHKNNTISKSNALISAKGSLSGSSQKMLASVISMIRADDTEFTRYALNRTAYLELIGSSSNNDEFFKETAKELMQNPFEIDGRLFNWCSMVDIVTMHGYVVFDIHPALKPYLLELKKSGNFTSYRVLNILTLKGEYSPRLYEYISMKWNEYRAYHKKAKSYTFELRIADMREMFRIPETYRYHDVKRQIIEKAVKQFKEKTDIQISYTEQKIGRKVDRILITVRANGKGSNDYMRSEKDFISHMRTNYKNEDLGTLKFNQKLAHISVSPEGKIYDKATAKDFEPKVAKKIWSALYQQAQEGKLLILRQPSLF